MDHDWEIKVEDVLDMDMLRFTPTMFRICRKCNLRLNFMMNVDDRCVLPTCSQVIMKKALE